MSSVNKVILVGNLGADPEFKETGTGLAKFPLATSESYKTKEGEKKEETQWHNVVIWGSLSQVAKKFLSKGKKVYIEGTLKTRSWDDQDGNKRYTTEVVVDFGGKMVMLSEKEGAYAKTETVITETVEEGDDLPF
jgi:single-strand DNA-binding protein